MKKKIVLFVIIGEFVLVTVFSQQTSCHLAPVTGCPLTSGRLLKTVTH